MNTTTDMTKLIIILCMIAVSFAGCTKEVNPDDIRARGTLSCISSKTNDILFHTDNIKSTTLLGLTDPYISVRINCSEIKMFESEGWICTHENGITESLFQRG